jgi:hypothetical protein
VQGGIRRVWVLGAGFSQPLGGPLLSDLFRQEPVGSLLHLYPEKEFPGLAETTWAVQAFFNLGRQDGRWRHAEAFLSAVDVACQPSNSQLLSQLQAAVNGAYFKDPHSDRKITFKDRHARLLSPLDRAVRRALAVECSKFLVWAHEELWAPYRGWVKSLEPANDVVVTFNYDRVLENVGRDRLQVLLPGEQRDPMRVPVYKLHGSVDWLVDPLSTVRRVPYADALLSEERLAMGVPGESKMAATEGEFAPLWKAALSAMSVANAIFLVGYSFPETDTYSQRKILETIRANESRHVRVDIVLGGPGVGDPYAARVQSLLRSCRGNRDWNDAQEAQRSSDLAWRLHVVHQRLWSQDFLPIFGYLLDDERWP